MASNYDKSKNAKKILDGLEKGVEDVVRRSGNRVADKHKFSDGNSYRSSDSKKTSKNNEVHRVETSTAGSTRRNNTQFSDGRYAVGNNAEVTGGRGTRAASHAVVSEKSEVQSSKSAAVTEGKGKIQHASITDTKESVVETRSTKTQKMSESVDDTLKKMVNKDRMEEPGKSGKSSISISSSRAGVSRISISSSRAGVSVIDSRTTKTQKMSESVDDTLRQMIANDKSKNGPVITGEGATDGTDDAGGKFNTMQKMDGSNLAGISQAALRNYYAGSDSYAGFSKMQHAGEMMGVGTVSRYSGKIAARDLLYHNKERAKLDEKIVNILGKNTKAGRSFTVVGDKRRISSVEAFRQNKALIEKELKKRNINPVGLTESQVRFALKHGFLGSKKGAHRKLGEEEKTLLKGWSQYKKWEGSVGLANGAGGIRNTVKAHANALIEDSDANTGLQMARGTKTAIKGGVWAVKGATGAAVNVGMSTVSGAAKLGSRIAEFGIKKHFMKKSSLSGGLTDAQLQRWHDLSGKAEKFRIRTTQVSGAVKGSVGKVVGRSTGENIKAGTKAIVTVAGKGISKGAKFIYGKSSNLQKAGAAIKNASRRRATNLTMKGVGLINRFNNTKFGRGLSKVRGVANTFFTRSRKVGGVVGHIFAQPFKGFSLLRLGLKKVKIILLVGLAFFMVLVCSVTSIVGAFAAQQASNSQATDENSGEMQEDIDENGNPISTVRAPLVQTLDSLLSQQMDYHRNVYRYYDSGEGRNSLPSMTQTYWPPGALEPITHSSTLSVVDQELYGSKLTTEVNGSATGYFTTDATPRYVTYMGTNKDLGIVVQFLAYPLERVHRAILALATGFTENYDEGADFLILYSTNIYQKWLPQMGYSNPNTDQSYMTVTKVLPGTHTPGVEDPTGFYDVDIKIYYKKCGLADICDLIMQDSDLNNTVNSGEWAKNNGSNAYNERDAKWQGWLAPSDTRDPNSPLTHENSDGYNIALNLHEMTDDEWWEYEQHKQPIGELNADPGVKNGNMAGISFLGGTSIPEPINGPTYKNVDLSPAEEADILRESGATGMAKEALASSLTKVGGYYSQENRYGGYDGDTYDCSSLAFYMWDKAGVDVTCGGVYSMTAAGEAQCLQDNGCEIFDTEELKPGDLIFYGGSDNGRHLGIYHVAIYAGGGYTVSAEGSSYGIAYRAAQTSDIVMYARPSLMPAPWNKHFGEPQDQQEQQGQQN